MLSKTIFVIALFLYIKLIVHRKLGSLAYSLMVLVSPVDYPPPLSDQFLVLLVDMIKSQMDIMEPLGLTQKEVERVMASNRYKGLDEKLLKVCNDPFLVLREKPKMCSFI